MKPMTMKSTELSQPEPTFADFGADCGGRLSELHIPAVNKLSCQLLLSGILRELNDCDDARWACWIGSTPVKNLLSEAVCKTGNHLLQVVTRDPEDITALASRALHSGRSHTVALMVHRPLTVAEQATLENAARCGDANCLVVRVDSRML